MNGWRTIAAHRPFVRDLAEGVLEAFAGHDPEALTRVTILAPNRRAARDLAQAFAEVGPGGPVLLPQIRPLGDLEADEPPFAPGDLGLDLPPAIDPLRRRFELARLVAAHDPASAAAPLRALEMADALAAFLDSCQIEEVRDLERIDGLVEADLAEHWREAAAFLAVAVRQWPARLEELGLVDPAARRTALLRALAERWAAAPPEHPLIVAGSTGAVPAAAAVMGAVARAPRGCVVLPGLDLDLPDEAWDQVDDQHPQGALKRLLARHRVARAEVRPWRGVETPRDAARRRLVAEALKPPQSTKDWRRTIDAMAAGPGDPVEEGLHGLSLVAARAEEEAAACAAVLMRETLETPGRTVALVSPDPLFARRVQARLSRWGLEADSSAGQALAGAPVGVLLTLLADLAAGPFGAAPLLALLKHELAGLGLEPGARRRAAEALERHGLRGPRPADWAAIARRLAEAREPRFGREPSPHVLAEVDRAEALLATLQAALDPWLAATAGGGVAVDAAARELAAATERLAGGADAWRGAPGEAAARLLAGLIEARDALPPLGAADFARLLHDLMARETVRTGGAAHPRLRILGAIEARLVRADRMILAGVEEGVWPHAAPIDPFLSRPMRQALGLPPPERRIGLSAHDFAQAACAPEVCLLHTERRGGQPTVKSRWLWRLETLVAGAGRELPSRPEVLAWARALDAPPEAIPDSLRPAARPAPRPPVELRPRRLSVTRVEEWVRDPYATYARAILRLEALPRPDERVDARLRGTAIHAALEDFARAWPELDPDQAPEVFAGLYLDRLRQGGMPEAALARETALARNAGLWAAGFESRRRADGPQVLIEPRGEMTLPAPREPFRLSARADRLEVRDGRLTVIDFKTGAAPTWKQVRTGFSPQLSLTAAIARAGGFADLGAVQPEALLYVTVTGRNPPALEVDRSGPSQPRDAQPIEQTVDEAIEGLARLIAEYEDPDRPFASRVAPQFAQRAVSDYDHLARVREWSVAEEGEAAE